jgi:HEAT repeat protein
VTDPRASGAREAERDVDTAAVATLLQAFLKALRAAQLYLPNNPVYQTAMQNVRKTFPPVWELTDVISLAVLETELKWDGEVVLSQPRNESLAWLLFKDGVRSIRIERGAEDEELVRLLQTINRARNLPPESEDDLLTLLWEQNFQFIRYDFIEPSHEEQRPISQVEEEEPIEVTREAIEAEAEPEAAEETDARLSSIVRLEDFDSTLYFLDERDINYLRTEIDREYQQDLRSNTLSILFDIFELQPFPAVRAEILSIVENFIPYLLGIGDFRVVAHVLHELRVVADRARELLPEHRTTLEELPARLSEPEAVSQLLQALDESTMLPSEQELSGLFRELRAEALEAILDWMPRLHAEQVRDLLGTAVQRIAAAHPDAVAKALGSENPAVVQATVRLAGRLKLPPTVPALGGLLIADQPADLKVAVVEALASIGTPTAMQQLERAVADGHRDVRVAAVRVLGGRRHRAALAPVEAAVLGRDLRTADLSEKTAFFEAYGLLAGPEGVRHLVPLLEAGGLFKKKTDPEIRACAAMALGKIGTEEARQALQTALRDKDPLVRNAAGRALEGGR